MHICLTQNYWLVRYLFLKLINLCLCCSQKGWPSPEIRGAVGLPWSPLSEQIQSPSVSSLYSGLESGRRAPILNSDYNNINQNILEHRSVNGNIYRNSAKAAPQSASTPTIPNACRSTEIEKFKKQHTPAESGVLRSHTITPNGKMAWPNERQLGSNERQLGSNERQLGSNERQLGWQPKNLGDKQTNVNHSWSNNNPLSNDEYEQWNNPSGPPTTSTPSSQNWQHQQGSFRAQDRGPLLFSPQPQQQMQRIVSISDV